MHRVRFLLAALIAATVVSLSMGVTAASGFAAPAFQQQWQQGEAITPNFWGPLATAHDGQQEPYKEASGGNRLVQYFDKGRMELTNGAVTNGLLATEIVKGQIQTGDSSFQNQAPPNIAIAGDADNPAPTYAGLSGKAAALLQPATSATGTPVTAVIGADGSLSSGSAGSDPAMVVGAFDDATKHNVAAAFVDYRNKAGLATIGLAISEPFRATVKVGGQSKDVMVQVFERRVLTYTASNDPAFKVEMGNIGAHYFAWRYPNGAVATVPSATTPAPSPGSTPTIPKGSFLAFAAPKTWTIDPTSTQTLIKLTGPAPSLQMTITVADQPQGDTLNNELGLYVAAVHKTIANFAVEAEKTDAKIGGEPADTYQYSGLTASNAPLSGAFAVVLHNGKVVTIETTTQTSNIPNFDDVTAIIQSITFL